MVWWIFRGCSKIINLDVLYGFGLVGLVGSCVCKFRLV